MVMEDLDFWRIQKYLGNLRDVETPQVSQTFLERVKSVFHIETPQMSESYRNIFDLGLRLCMVCVSAYISARILAAVLDPDSEKKKQSQQRVAALLKRLGIKESSLQLTEHEIQIATQVVDIKELDKCWDDIGGQEELIKEISDTLILPMRMKKAKVSSLMVTPNGVLLHGPPGCGKTLIAQALAKATGARFLNLDVSSLTNKWYGESEKLTAALFSLAKKLQPIIIFIDEIDAFLRQRNFLDHEVTAMRKAQFMTLWDGFASDPSSQVVIVGATNRPNDVDAAILRRMPARFHIRRPDTQQRLRILEVILRREEIEEGTDLATVAEAAEGFSGSDLREVCRLAVIRRVMDAMGDDGEAGLENARPLQLADLLDSVEKVKLTQILKEWGNGQSAFPVD